MSKLFYDNSRTVQRSIRQTRWTILLLMLITSATLFYIHGGYRPLIFTAIGLLWFLLFPASYRWRLSKSLDRTIKEGPYEKNLGTHTIQFHEAGFSSQSPVSESNYKWDAIDRVLLTDAHLHIFLAGMAGFPIPRREIEDDVIRDVQALVESKIRK